VILASIRVITCLALPFPGSYLQPADERHVGWSIMMSYALHGR
jgi:hypothetical protein